MAIEKIDDGLCNGCGICVDTCPTDVLRMDDKTGKAYIAYPIDCTVCFLCEWDCPESAIHVSPLPARKLIHPY